MPSGWRRLKEVLCILETEHQGRPELFDVVEARPTSKVFKSKTHPSESDLAGARDRALLLVGFVAALRRRDSLSCEWRTSRTTPTDWS